MKVVEDRYKNNCAPFQKLWRYQRSDTVFEVFQLGSAHIKMDIWCTEKGYEVIVWNPKDDNSDIKISLSNITVLADFHYKENNRHRITRTFEFHQEEELFDFIDAFKAKLEELQSKV